MKNNDYLKLLVMDMGKETSLSQLQNYVEDMVKIRGFDKETPQDAMLLLTEEVGELAKEVRKAATNIKNDKSKKGQNDLEGEAADVLMMLLALCRTLNIDLMEAFKNKELINCQRNWE